MLEIYLTRRHRRINQITAPQLLSISRSVIFGQLPRFSHLATPFASHRVFPTSTPQQAQDCASSSSCAVTSHPRTDNRPIIRLGLTSTKRQPDLDPITNPAVSFSDRNMTSIKGEEKPHDEPQSHAEGEDGNDEVRIL